MNVNEAILTRRSIRAFKPQSVPKDTLAEIVRVASWSPSGYNTQPWYITIAAGKTLDELREALVKQFEVDPHAEPVVSWYNFNEIHKERRRHIGYRVLESKGISREDKMGRVRWYQQMLRFFNAPAGLIIQTESNQGSIALYDLGMLSMSIMLAANSYGLGTCIIGLVAGYPETMRHTLSLPEDRLPLLGLAIGYPDLDAPVNLFHRDREPLEGFVQWQGFGGD